MKISGLLKAAKGFCKSNKATIRLVESCTLFVVGMGAAAIGTLRAEKKIREAQEEAEENDEELTKLDIVKIAAPEYIPAIACAIGGTVCAVNVHKTMTKDLIATATALDLYKKQYIEYRESAKEIVGEAKEKLITERVAEHRLEDKYYQCSAIESTGHGDIECIDPFLRRRFYCCAEYIRQCVNKLNNDMNVFQYASINDFYGYLGLEPCGAGYDLGWNEQVDIEITAELNDMEKPILVLSYMVDPRADYRNLW